MPKSLTKATVALPKVRKDRSLKPGPQAYYATGRRKTSSARVFIKPSGQNQIIINSRTIEAYFKRPIDVIKINTVLKTANVPSVDVIVTVKGGGTTGQCDAIILGIARALIIYDETLRPTLKEKGWLKRDARKVERKKYGLKKARKAEQYSKR